MFAPALRMFRGPRNDTEIRVTVISDTHGQHDDIDLPASDLLIHCGDMFDLSNRTPGQIAQMDAWFGRQKFERILYTGGNHDRVLEAELARRAQPMQNAYFLRDEAIEFRGLTIYGAPWVPNLPGQAFSKNRIGLAEAWAKVPPNLDILVTHTPPLATLDTSSRGQSYGCQILAGEMKRIAPRVHCFGHVHASAGRRKVGETLFINAASMKSGTGTMRPPTAFGLSPRID